MIFLRETQTYEIIDDVAKMRSEIGILYLNDFNRTVLKKIIKANDLEFETLFTTKPHIFVSTSNPLAGKESVTMEDLKAYPYLSFEQENTTLFTFQRKYSVLQSVRRISVYVTARHFLIY